MAAAREKERILDESSQKHTTIRRQRVLINVKLADGHLLER
jgi:hypothetical protein